MGHTIYYSLNIKEWEDAKLFIRKVAKGLGLKTKEEGTYILINPEIGVEPLLLGKSIVGFAKTYGREPINSLYLLLLYSLSKFGKVEVWEDE